MLLGAHVEGPWLAPRCRGGHALEYLRVPEKGDVDKLLGEVGGVIKTVTFAPELPGAAWLAERLAGRGILPVIGHTEGSYEDAERAILAGARHVTHMYDAIIGYRENPKEALVMMPGVETAVLMHDEVSIELNGCPIHVPIPFFGFINKVKPPDKKVIVTDSLAGTGYPDGTVITKKNGRRIYVSKGVLRMIDEDPGINGNLTGSAVTMNLALRRLTEYAKYPGKLPVHEAVRWGTINPATTLGIAGETGSLAVGKLADIVLFDDDFDVKTTLLKGGVVYNAV
jgi:N-acetylglucosamine-6-phosphate deacetylase